MKTVNVTLRIPADLHEVLMTMATADQRSLNQFLQRTLRKAIGPGDATPKQPTLPGVSRKKTTKRPKRHPLA